MFKKKRRAHKPNKGYKFCPVCGAQLERTDAYCTQCGYSFVERHKKHKKGIKWRNIIFIIIIILLFYFSIRYFNNQPIIPSSFQDIFNLTIANKTG